MRSIQLSLVADYFQFYIQDEAVTGDLSDSWNDEATARLLAIAPGTIGIGTVRNMDVVVVVEIHDQKPLEDLDAWDHVVEASIDLQSGRLVIAGCTDYFPDATRIDVPSGCYLSRVSYGGLNGLSDDGLRGDDHYRIQLWPGASSAVSVIKQRST
ncbi:hypothetical protein [Dongia sp. agr-C8]